ncbi:hypothetical protein LX86_007847 [Lentzea aerocolonigenes]|nr:hypothetical protein [Lentzea aerocolonigenes]
MTLATTALALSARTKAHLHHLTVTTAVALYARTRAQFHHLTHPATLHADHNHPHQAVSLDFRLHRPATPRRRRLNPLKTAVRRLLAAYQLPPLPPPHPLPLAPERPQCRLCAATS